MNAVAFAILAVLIVAACLGTVVLPRLRDAGTALLVTLVLIAVLSAASGQYIVAVAEVLAAAGGAAAGRSVLKLGSQTDRPAGDPRLPRFWWAGGGAALALGGIAAVVLGASGGDLVQGGGAPSNVSVLGEEPYALIVAALLAVFGFAAGALLGRTSDDEREADARQAARLTREERSRARREAREAARRQRRGASPAGEKG